MSESESEGDIISRGPQTDVSCSLGRRRNSTPLGVSKANTKYRIRQGPQGAGAAHVNVEGEWRLFSPFRGPSVASPEGKSSQGPPEQDMEYFLNKIYTVEVEVMSWSGATEVRRRVADCS